MSLEDALKANTEALDRHSKVLEKFMAAGAGKTAATEKAADKPAEKPAKAADKPAKPAAGKAKAGPTQEEVQERVSGYIKAVTDKAERDVRKEHVRRIVEYYGVERFTLIDPAKFAEALAMLADFEAGNEPEALTDPDNEGGEEGDDDDNMV